MAANLHQGPGRTAPISLNSFRKLLTIYPLTLLSDSFISIVKLSNPHPSKSAPYSPSISKPRLSLFSCIYLGSSPPTKITESKRLPKHPTSYHYSYNRLLVMWVFDWCKYLTLRAFSEDLELFTMLASVS